MKAREYTENEYLNGLNPLGYCCCRFFFLLLVCLIFVVLLFRFSRRWKKNTFHFMQQDIVHSIFSTVFAQLNAFFGVFFAQSGWCVCIVCVGCIAFPGDCLLHDKIANMLKRVMKSIENTSEINITDKPNNISTFHCV